MDIICLELTHHVRLCDSSVDVTHDNLFVFIPEEYLKLSLFHLPRSNLE